MVTEIESSTASIITVERSYYNSVETRACIIDIFK